MPVAQVQVKIKKNSFQYEEKRDEFRKYLESTGATEKLTSAMIKLYQETERPEDAITYITKLLCESCPDTDATKELKEEIKELKLAKERVEIDLNAARCEVRKTPSETDTVLTTLFKALDDDEKATSLLKEYLTVDIFGKLKSLRTDLRGSLLDNIQCGLTHFDAEIGVYASDQYAYNTFALLFKPILEDIHETEAEGDTPAISTQPEVDWGNSEELNDLDPEKLFIKSISITVGRAVNGVPFMPTIKLDELTETAEKFRKIFTDIEDEDYAGKYYELIDIEEEQRNQWIEEGILFPGSDDKFLKAAETYRFWPLGRGLFLNEKKNFRAWINEEEHLQMTAFEEHGNLRETYQRLINAFDFMKGILFARNDRWGFPAHNLKNIGNTMRITVKAKLPQLSLPENDDKLKLFSDKNNVIVKNLGMGLMELTNKKRFGITEIDTAKAFQQGIDELIKAEKCLYA